MPAKDALVGFYAIFWGILLSKVSELSPFGIDGFFRGCSSAKKTALRFLLAILLLNIFPALWLVYGLMPIIPCDSAPHSFIAAAFAALSVFGFLNFTYGLLAARPCRSFFYGMIDRCKLRKKGALEEVRSIWFILLGFAYLILFDFMAHLVLWIAAWKML